MKLAKTKEKYLKCAILIISICFILGALSACLPFNISIPDKLEEDAIDNTAMNITTNSSDGLGEFKNGYNYVYTDKDLIDDYRAGNPNTPYDISIVKVDTSQARGTQKNPYVIASVDDWETFAKMMGPSTSDRGLNKYFVLANDLDFKNRTFRPIPIFKGTFCGMGNELLNITINSNNWKYWSGSDWTTWGTYASAGFGVFGRTDSAIITDLIVQDFNFTNMPQTSALNYGNYQGGLIGVGCGNEYILNCHINGTIDDTGVTYSHYVWTGGIMGISYPGIANNTVTIYRCSADTVFIGGAFSSSHYSHGGGLIGEARSGVNTNIYDCAVNYDFRGTKTSMDYSGPTLCINRDTARAVVENVVANLKTNSTTRVGVLYPYGSFNIVKNIYADGAVGENGAIGLISSLANNPTSPTNINIGQYVNTTSIATKYTNSNDLYQAAKNAVGSSLPSQIWDASKIGGYTPDTSPVRNYLLAFVSYRNLTNGGNDEESVGIEDGLAYLPGADLESQPGADYLASKSSNQVFLGWTDDTTGASEPFKELPSGMFGEVTLYAVWGLSSDHVDKYVNPTLTVKDSISEITYDTKASITLNANVEYTGASDGGMTDPQVTYLWKQGSKDRSDTNTGTFKANKVADSGTYTYDYIMKDKAQPLWLYKDSSGMSETITINKGIISIDTFEVTNEPYYGKALTEVTFDVTAKNSAGVKVALSSATWKNTVGQEVKKGENTQTVRLIPTDTDNYGDYADLTVKFDSETLYVTFVFPELAEQLKAELTYGQNYGSKEIIYEFNQVYMDALANNPEFSSISDSGLAPYLADEDEIKADPTYKGAPIVEDSSGKALYNKVHKNVTEEFSIYVYFNAVTYTVAFDANSSSNTTVLPAPEAYGYGKFVIKPDKDPTNGELLFVGWYFTDSDGEYRAWRFFSEPQEDGTVIPQDRVSGNLTLTAEWLNASNLDEVTFTVSPTAKFIALNKIDSGDYLTVTAKYSGSKNGITATSDKTIAYGNYVIEYGRMDGEDFVGEYNTLKVVDGGMYIRVGVQFGVTTVYSEPKQINVEPIDITDLTEQFNFGDDDNDGIITFEYDGTGKTVRKLTAQDVLTMTNGQITGITYQYKNSFTNQLVDEPTDIGTYSVTISYTTASGDFYAKPTELTVKITSTIKVRVEWTDSTLMYSGGEQHPTVAKIYNVDTGEEVSVNSNQITYTGDTDAKTINIGTHYKVSVSLGDSYTVTDGKECTFDIVKALLEIPTYTSGTIMYDGTTKSLVDYLGDAFNPLLMEIVSGGTGKEVDTYRAMIALKDTINCSWADKSIASKQVEWKIEPAILYVSWDKWEFVSDGESAYAPKINGLMGLASGDTFDYDTDFVYKIYDEEGNLMDVSQVSEIGSYRIVASFNGDVKNYTLDSTSKEWYFVVVPKSGMTVLTIEWGETQFLYDGGVHYPTFTVKDSNGKDVTEEISSMLKFSDGYRKEKELGTYSVKVTLSGEAAEEYFIRSGATVKYKIVDENGYAPDEEETANRDKEDKDGDKDGSGIDFDSILEAVKEYWQAIVSGICIILIIAFLSKTASYESRRKRANKTANERYKSYYAGAVGLFGWASSSWTIIACVFIALTVASLVIMLIAKSRCRKAEDSLAYSKEDFERNQMDIEYRRREEEARQRDENMRMMFMSMMGGNNGNMGQGMSQGGYMGGGYKIGAEEIRGIISDTVTALLPGVQQLLPQQASTNDELVQKLIDQNEKLMEKSQKNEEEMRDLIKKLAEHPADKEVVATNVNEETIRQLIDKNDERFEQIMKTQEALIAKLLEKDNTPQVIEKVVEVPVEVEKIVEKEVKVEVPVEVEKIVEKEVVKEVPVEKIVEVPVEKVVEKVIEKEVKVTAPAKPKVEKAPRLTLDEAYALLSKEQKKYFDGLRDYALTKYKCKEKKSTYFVVFGRTSTNPLLKLTIKKDTTVALLKMEDEYMKDIRRDATGDGTKVKVKETEVVVSDAQAYATAKKMVDLRDDQIERYQDLLREQRAMRNKK
ncbi:MAG: hypothetical protein K2K85_08605 [Clostridia bacterium]|nr:hypothetical protein [Clostridia bacterium]